MDKLFAEILKIYQELSPDHYQELLTMSQESDTDKNLKESCGEILLTYFDEMGVSNINVDKLQKIVSIMGRMDIDLNKILGCEGMTLLHYASIFA